MNQEIKYLLFIFVTFGIGSIILQSVLTPYLEIYSWRPDFVLVIVLLIGRRFGSVTGSTLGFIMGLLQDSLTAMPVGITALPKAMAGYATGKMGDLKLEGSVNFLWFIFFIFLHEFVFYAVMQFKMDISFAYLVYSRVFPNTIYTTIILLVTYSFSNKFFTDAT